MSSPGKLTIVIVLIFLHDMGNGFTYSLVVRLEAATIGLRSHVNRVHQSARKQTGPGCRQSRWTAGVTSIAALAARELSEVQSRSRKTSQACGFETDMLLHQRPAEAAAHFSQWEIWLRMGRGKQVLGH